jgi:nucleoside 2-deoxyribosyltransferase
MKVYISGPISGIDGLNKKAFEEAKAYLLAIGHEPTSPHDICLGKDQSESWVAFMREDIKALMDCDAIYMLAGWSHSRGAAIEYSIAERLGYKMMGDI